MADTTIPYDPYQTDPLTQQRNQLLQQNIVPQIQNAQVNQPTAPTMQQTTPIQYVNPYAAIYGGRESVLSKPDEQQQLGDAFNKMLGSVVTGPNAALQREQSIANIFGGAAAALGGLMGKGYAAGGMNVLNQVNQQVQDARAERHQNQQDALTGMKSLADVISSTSPYSQKMLASKFKATMDAQKESDKVAHQNNNDINTQNKNAVNLYGKQSLANHYQAADAWKGYGLVSRGNEVDNRLLEQLTTAKMADEIRQEVANIGANAKNYKTDEDYQKALNQAKQQWQAAALTRTYAGQKADQAAAAEKQKLYANGNPMYANLQLPSMSQAIQQDLTDMEPNWDELANARNPKAQQGQPTVAPVPVPQGQQSGVNPAQAGGMGAAKLPAIDTGTKQMFQLVNKAAGLGGGNKDMFMAEAQSRGLDPQAAAALWKQIGGK